VFAPDVLIPDRSNPSIIGLGGFVIAVLTFAIVLFDRVIGRGRALATIDGKIDRLCAQIEDVESRMDVVDGLAESVRELTQEWRGVPGSDNGYRNIIRENRDRIAAIEKRNDKIDAIREEDLRRGHGQQRRHADRELNNLLPQEREEKA
jgi:hypothetical protein